MSQSNHKKEKANENKTNNRMIYLAFSAFWIVLAIVTLILFTKSPSHESTPYPWLHNLEDACKNSDTETIQKIYSTLNAEEQEKGYLFIHRVGCLKHSGLNAADFYTKNANWIFDTNPPYSPTLTALAFTQLHSTEFENQKSAALFLANHYEKLEISEKQSFFSSILETQNAELIVLAFLPILSPEMVQALEELPLTPELSFKLLNVWTKLSPNLQAQLLKPYIDIHWHMQSSGSSQMPQNLSMVIQRYPLPKNVESFVSIVKVQKLSIDRDNLMQSSRNPVHYLESPPMFAAGSFHLVTNLSPWLNTAQNYRVFAEAALFLLNSQATSECIENPESENCQNFIFHKHTIPFDIRYRVFSGVETGAPTRNRENKSNEAVNTKLILEVCNSDNCFEIWNGKKKTVKNPIPIQHNHDLYLKISALSPPELPLAARLMARSKTQDWLEIASFFSHIVHHEFSDIRAEIDLTNLCPNIGHCSLEFQLRPSLRMARKDARIKQYWGTTLQLGHIPFSVQNPADGVIWQEFAKELEK